MSCQKCYYVQKKRSLFATLEILIIAAKSLENQTLMTSLMSLNKNE